MCSNRQICPLGCHCSDKAPHSYAELRRCAARRLMPHTLQLTVFCCMQPHRSWKKPNSFIRISCYSSSITLKSSLWRRQGTEAMNGLRSAAKVGMREEDISQQFFEKVYQKKEPLAPAVMCHMWACVRFRHLPGSGITGNETFCF